jgi:DNA-binding protein H-NS
MSDEQEPVERAEEAAERAERAAERAEEVKETIEKVLREDEIPLSHGTTTGGGEVRNAASGDAGDKPGSYED